MVCGKGREIGGEIDEEGEEGSKNLVTDHC